MARIITVPAFSDNYIWLICDENKENCLIVDPGDPRRLITLLKDQNIQPLAILITHFHFDHGNGIPELLELYPNLPIYGPDSEYQLLKNYPDFPREYGPASHCFLSIDKLSNPLEGGETLTFEKIGCSFKVINVPGHTSGHIAYYDEENKNLFCGDTLFAGGCGRVFNGSMEMLHDSLQTIKALHEDTLIHCAHEYTLDNLGFSKWVEPENEDISNRLEADMKLIDNDQATVPSQLSLELKTNPFLRTDLPHVKKKVEEATGKSLNSSREVFAAMRTWKDTEYD